jgi:hypothetical protein
MQTKLFEPFERTGVGERAEDSAGSNHGGSNHTEGLPNEARFDHRDGGGGAVVIHTSSRAIYGTQNTEFWIQKGLPAISFADLVRESSGHLVLPIDPCSREDMLLLNHLSQTLTAFVRLTERSGQRFTGNRINDVGKRFEYIIADQLRKTPFEAAVLGRPGYPDCVLRRARG